VTRDRLASLLLSVSVLLAVWSIPARAGILLERWVTTPGGSPDGMALGDVDGDGRLEIALITRGGTYDSTTQMPGVGGFALLNQDGSVRFAVPSTTQLVGYPVFGDFDGDSFAEVAFCENDDEGYCYVYDGNGTLQWSVGPLYFPSMTNGGPSVADIDNDGYDDLLIASYGGEVRAVRGPSGTQAWAYDMYTPYNDIPFGHIAIADIDRDGTLEMVIGGSLRGGIYVLNTEVSPANRVQLAIPNLYATYQNYFHASGPVLVNLDSDAPLEIVATMAGDPGPAAIFAFKANGTLKWRTTVTTDALMYSSASAADTDGNGLVEVFVQTFGGVMLAFNPSTGALLQQRALGANSWASPSFMDNDFDGQMEILTSTLSGVYLLNSNLSEIDRYTNSSSGMFPPPIVGDTDADGRLDLITGAWYPRQILSIRLPYTSAYSWSAFGGSAKHSGAVPAGDPATLLGDDPAPASAVLLTAVHNASLAVTNNTQRARLQDARYDLDIAYRTYLRGDPHLAVDRLRQALAHLVAANTAGYNTVELQKRTAYLGILIFEQYIDRTQAIVGPSEPAVITARSTLATAKTRYNTPNYTTSIQSSDNGAAALRTFLDTPSEYVVGAYCPAALGETYFAWECRIVSVRAAVLALRASFASGSTTYTRLTTAYDNLRTCLAWGPDIVFQQAYTYCQTADTALGQVTTTDVTMMRRDLAFAIMRNTRLFIDDAAIWFRDYDQSALTQAETFFAQGETAFNGNDFTTAHARFISSYAQARPCAEDSFSGDGSNPQGLEGGGCSP
jgi:hypothetical protein